MSRPARSGGAASGGGGGDASGFLRAVGVTREYRDGERTLRVLKGIDLCISRGEVVAVVGPSGAGKSTLLHILGALDRPTGGQVLLDDVSVYSLPDRARARMRCERVGFVFQMYHLMPEFSALENVMLPAMVDSGARAAARAGACGRRAGALLTDVGLAERSHHRPSTLSGGEQQRVAIARALMNNPEVLIADEPTGNLDEVAGAEVLSILWRLNEGSGQTIILATHDRELAELADRVVVLQDGAVTGERAGGSASERRGYVNT